MTFLLFISVAIFLLLNGISFFVSISEYISETEHIPVIHSLQNTSYLELVAMPIFGTGIITAFLVAIPVRKIKSLNWQYRPFKKPQFKIGEEVLYGNTRCIVVLNEKSFSADQIRIKGDHFEVTVYVHTVKKLTPLEQELK